jgi:vacuolar protein sorting-associated protein 16
MFQVGQTHLQDDVVAREIANKLGQAPGISYTDIANRAIDAHRNQLALKVVETSLNFCSNLWF